MFSFLLKFCGFQNEVEPYATRSTLTNMALLSDEGRAKVYSAEFNGKAVAVKLFHDKQLSQEHSDYSVPDYNLFLNEVESLQKLKHPNIIQLYSFIAEENYQALVLELMPNKSFKHYLKTHINDSRDKKRCTRIALDVCKGLVYLHALRLIHCDIKAENVLLDSQMSAKICDFEMVTELLPVADFALTENAGTTRWSAPERYDRKLFKQAYDIYPLGWLIFLGQIKVDVFLQNPFSLTIVAKIYFFVFLEIKNLIGHG